MVCHQIPIKSCCHLCLGADVDYVDLGSQTMDDGKVLPLPPVLMGSKKTLLVYSHLDVQPAALEDGWDTEPWILTECGSMLFSVTGEKDRTDLLLKRVLGTVNPFPLV